MPYISFRSTFSTLVGRAVLSILAVFATNALVVNAQPVSHTDHRPSSAAVPVAVPPSPSATSITTPIPQPRSIFERYQHFDADTPLTDWHSANKTVQQIGGWRVYAREAAADAAKQSARLKQTPSATTGATK